MIPQYKYVAGFLFNEEKTQVALIRKNKPDWQKGNLNGIGGKIDRKTQGHSCYDIDCDVSGFNPCTCPYETPLEAMIREFREETGVEVNSWNHYVTLRGKEFEVHFFYAVAQYDEWSSLRSTTDEQVGRYSIDQLPHLKTILNLQWLIPMALTMEYEQAEGFEVWEIAA